MEMENQFGTMISIVLLVSVHDAWALWINSSPVVWIRHCNDTDLSTGFCITNNTSGIFSASIEGQTIGYGLRMIHCLASAKPWLGKKSPRLVPKSLTEVQAIFLSVWYVVKSLSIGK